MYEWHADVMDLFELARTFQADREREIASTLRRRRLLTPTQTGHPDVARSERTDTSASSPTGLGQSLASTRSTR